MVESASVKARTVEFVDVLNPAVGLDCPRCGLWTARFGWFCRNCAYRLWPNAEAAGRAYRTWRLHDASRMRVHQWDDELPVEETVLVVDFRQRAHELGIHVFPSSHWPIVVCAGLLFAGLAAVPLLPVVRIILAVIGVFLFVLGVGGWMLEDVRLYPAEDEGAHGEAHGVETHRE